jgi:AraC family transcriptional regulator
MYESEILAREVATGGSVTYTEHTVECSSTNAPWRDLIRLERSRKALDGRELTSLWTSVGIVHGEGVLDLRVDAEPLQTLILSAGCVFIYPQGASIFVRMVEPVDGTCLQIAPSVLMAVADELGRSSKVSSYRGVRDEQIERMAALLETELKSGCSGGRLYGEYQAYAFATYLIQRYAEATPHAPLRNGRLGNAKLSAVLEYIQAHATQDVSLHDLARTAHLSPFHFSRLFKQSTGLTPHQYVLQWRIDEAKRLLRHSRLDLAEIASRLGFQDQSHFTARFRILTGATPKRWRESV